MFKQILYGGDYNPEQWDARVWQEDAELMQAAGVNRVSLGVFSWARLEPEPGQYDFAWMRQVIDLLYAHGVQVNLATPTASPPPWLALLDPHTLPVNAAGQRLLPGSRRHVCPHSAEYRRRALEIATRLAQEFGDHPALALWHIDNEYGCHISECFCEQSQAAFRVWLQQRYGTIDALNEAWGTSFWSQHYRDFDEIHVPAPTPASANPTQKLDWRRFTSDSWLECFQEQIDLLRGLTPNIPVTTNFMRWHPPMDYWKWAAREDFVSLDDYPDQSDPQWMMKTAMVFDLTRSLKGGQPWLLMEQAPAHVNWRVHNPTKRPGQMRLGSYQALAHGADGIMFFQWRAAKAGSEKFHSAMLPHAGAETRVHREIKTLGAELGRLTPLLDSRVKADVAILFDWESWWALEAGDKPANDFDLLGRITTLYGELYSRSISVDFAHPEGDLSGYRLVIAPHVYLLGARAAHNLDAYVAQGGALWMSFFSGIVDANDHVGLGGYPAALRQALGIRVEEHAALAPQDRIPVVTDDGRRFTCDFWAEIVHLEGAASLATYQGDYVSGGPAITHCRYGQGAAYYQTCAFDAAGLSWLVERICRETGVAIPAALPAGVEITRRSKGRETWLFVLNHAAEPVRVSVPAGVELISGAAVDGEIELEAYGVAVIRVLL